MKKILLMMLMMATAANLVAQTELSTLGTDFWVAFMPNWHNTDVDTYTISVSGSRNCSATITNPNTGWSHTMSVTANNATSYNVPAAQCWQSGAMNTFNTGLHITATDSVQVFAFNHSGSASTSDATILYTTQSLGFDYMVQTFAPTSTSTDIHSQFSILAVEDNTVVDITYQGNASTSVTSGTTQTITLNAGQVYQVQANQPTADLSGTTITARNCMPIAVFMGNSCTNVPSTNTTSTDHTYSQALSTNLWKSEWLLVPQAYHDIDYLKITAKENGTTITVNGTVRATLAAGQSQVLDLTSAAHVVASQPCLLQQFLDSRHHSNEGGDFGDVAAFLPNSIDCKSNHAVFPSFELNNRFGYTTMYYVNVVFPTSEATLLRLDGANITDPSTAIAGTNYSYKRIMLTHGTHILSTTGSGFIAHAYGLGENWEGYVMSLGGTDANISPVYRFGNDTIVESVCGSSFTFYDTVYHQSGTYIHTSPCNDSITLMLTLHDNDTLVMDTAICGTYFTWNDHTYEEDGTFFIIVDSNRYGCDSIIHLNLQFHPTYDTAYSISYCDSTITLFGNTYPITDSTTINATLPTMHGCDSSFHITIIPEAVEGFEEIYSCDSIYWRNGKQYQVPSVGIDTLKSAHNCDSIVTLQLELAPSYYFLHEDTVISGQTYQWINGYEFEDSVVATLTFQTIYGCDSTYQLILHNIKPPTPEIWAPNVFTPTRSNNQLFRIFSANIDEMTVSIFHRWGEQICTFDGLHESWDGRYKGHICPQAAYVYKINYHAIGSNETPEPIVGTVLLLR